MAINFEKDSEVLKAMGHPVRLQIVAGLLEPGHDKCNVNRMVERLGIPQSTVSQHLAILRRAGIVVPRKEGVKTCYHVADGRIPGLVKLLKS